jgi:SP family sugar:H+ symporter-like MFS transporter
MPESPRWLEAHGRPEEAQKAVNKLHGVNNTGDDAGALAQYQEIKRGVEEELKRSKATWADCFRPRHKTLYRTLLGMSLQSFQQLTGKIASFRNLFTNRLLVRRQLLVCALPELHLEY